MYITDEWQQEIRLNFMEDMLMLAYAREVTRVMPEVIRLHCMGCGLLDEFGEKYDHPSQTQHDICVMMTLPEQVNLCFEDALHLVEDSDGLFEEWYHQLETMDPPASYLEKIKYQCMDWRLTEWLTEKRKEDLQIMVQDFLTSNDL